MVNMISCKCPECAAEVSVEENREFAFCSYCGAKILLQNDNERIYRHIDEAEVKRADTEQAVKLKQMEMEEKDREAEERLRPLKIKLTLGFAVVGLLLMSIGLTIDSLDGLGLVGLYAIFGAMIIGSMSVIGRGRRRNKNEDDNRIEVPSDVREYRNSTYPVIEVMFRKAGFTNIVCMPMNDLTTGWVKKPDTVGSITVNGKNVTGGEKFDPNATVTILFHSFPNR